MTFDELVALLREPGEDGLPETIYDDLSASYTGAVEGGAAALTAQDEVNQAALTAQAEVSSAAAAELVAEIARLKALNFDLLMAAGTETEKNETEPESTDEPSIDSLFDKG